MRTILVVLAIVATWARPDAVVAQDPLSDQAASAVSREPAAAEAAPGVYDVAARVRMVLDSAILAERAIVRLGDTLALADDVNALARRHGELQLLLATLVESDYIRPERVTRLRDQAVIEDQRLEGLLTRVEERLQQLGVIRGEWLRRSRTWQEWQAALQGDPDVSVAAEDLARVVARSDSIVSATASVAADLTSLQRRINELRVDTDNVGRTLTALQTDRRQALWQRDQPVLLSRQHRSQLLDTDAQAWLPVAALTPAVYVTFARNHAGLLALHLFIVLAIALAAIRLRPLARPEDGWGELLAHPWAIGVIGTVVFAMQRVMLAPPLWDVALWSLFAAAAAVLARPLFPTRALLLTVYLFAIFYPVFLFLEVAGLATPVFRLVLAAVAGAALPVFTFYARRRSAAATAAGSNDPRRIWPLRFGAAMWAVVLVAVFLGFDLFGRWVLHAAVTTGAAAFVVVLTVALLRGLIATLLRSEGKGRFLRSIAVPFARRVVSLLQAVLVFAAILVVASIWELTPSPVATWQLIVGAGVDIAGIRITAGRLLLGFVVIYLAVVVSWLVRSFLQSEAFRRWNLDRGVGESINKLVHYTLIVIGLFTALAVLGFELQNFAIVAGALGIGIGFGLQNVVNNFASGLILLFERPVRVGDTVVVDGEWGTIRKIGLRSTVMLTFDQSEMIVPNADLVSEKVVNWTLSNPVARVILEVGAAYGSDVGRVLQILGEAGSAHPDVLPDPPPSALFVGFGDSSLDFELRVWVREIRQRLEVRSAVLTEIERRFAEAGIEIPFPQRDLHLRSVDENAAGRLRGSS
ncbi:MAG TPA: mechanosensitive ion channel domain-containing protein [Longimicrobiales bacterium]|nr:mechanosensitive ion channel domain-containing protein [Longimicrobiales bacterium]